MITVGQLFILTVCVFIFYAIFLSIEKRRKKRLILGAFRGFIDSVLVNVTDWLRLWLKYLGRHIIKLSWYYGIHRFLRLILTILVKMYDSIESLFLQNRNRAKAIRIEKRLIKNGGHFDKVADHKLTSALSDEEKKDLLAKKLERE